jgi:peroxiredoxin
MFKFWLPDFFTTLIIVLSITITSSQAGASEEKQHIASNFTLENLEGKEVSLSQFRGKFLLINFWATWCGPCKIEMPSLEELYRKFKSDNFDMLGISNDMFGDKVVRPYVKAAKITFPMLLDQRMIVSRQYGIVSLPTTILIDPKGIIIGVLQGAEDWSAPETLLYFEDLLKKS